MNGDDFYLTAPSNASYRTYSDNTQSSFRIRTAKAIDLSRYTVALTEIQYPKSWLTISDCSLEVRRTNADTLTAHLPGGRYVDIEQLVDVIQRHVTNLRLANSLLVTWDPIRLKTSVIIRASGMSLSITPQLGRILGFETYEFTTGVTGSKHHSDIDEGMSAIYVYSNIVQNQLVGDSLVPLLRVVPIRGARGELYRSEEFLHPHYLPTVKETTSELQFHLRRDDGSDISFKTGKVVLTLHFRKI
jgi:hypothetical protein